MSASVSQIPRGLADPKRNVAYVSGPGDSIDRLNLRSGDVDARTGFPAESLTLDDDALIGWRTAPDKACVIVAFSAVREGGQLRPKWETRITLPDWVDAGAGDPGRFSLEGAIENGVLRLTWEAGARYSDGAPPPMQVEAASTRHEGGVVRLDAATGTLLDEEERTAMTPGSSRTLPALPGDRRIVPYQSRGDWETMPWRAGAFNAHLVKATDAPGILLVHRDPDSGEVLQEMRLSASKGVVASVTLDGGFVFVHETDREEPSWDLFSARTGERLASFPFDPGTQEVAIVNDQILYLVVEESETSRRWMLRSRGLDGAEPVWSHLLTEEVLSGPPPLRQ